jgi:hypothetical protein
MFRYTCNLYLYKVTGGGEEELVIRRLLGLLEERYEFYVFTVFCYLLSFAICDGNSCRRWVMFSQTQSLECDLPTT